MSNVASADDGVVRVRVADYERLLANMLAEAESRVSAAEAETSCARDEADALRAELDRALARESESARTYETWRDALVETAADELAAEASRWRDAMDARDDIVESTRRDADAAAAAAERREARHADLIRACIAEYPETAAFWAAADARDEAEARGDLARRVDAATKTSVEPASTSSTGAPSTPVRGTPPSFESPARQSPDRSRHGRTRSMSFAAPVATSSSSAAAVAEAKEEAARRMADATARAGWGETAEAKTDGGTTTSWLWPFG